MSKPREFFIEEGCRFPDCWDVNIVDESFNPDGCIHVIEKSAADKLAQALEWYVSRNLYEDRPSAIDANIKVPAKISHLMAKQALADYRGDSKEGVLRD